MTFARWYSASVQPVQRSEGRSSVAAASYRLGARLSDERLGVTHDYRAKSGILATFTVAPADAPEWAHDPERLWNAAEQAERVNGRPARELLLALPFACSMDERIAIAEKVAAELVDRYHVAASVGVHAPDQEGDQRNFHAHILFTTREVHEDGLGAKTRVLDDRKTGPDEITYIRQFCADTINDALAAAGSDERVSHLSYADLGIDEVPSVHMGPQATAKERRGEESGQGATNREIADDNQSHRSRMDELYEEMAALDREIAARTAEQFEDDLLLRGDPGDDLATSPTGAGIPADASAEYSMSIIQQRMLAKAAAELTVMAAERASTWSDAISQRVSRIGEWWHNMREHFVEWRDHLQETATSWWDRIHPAEAPTPAPTTEQPPPEHQEPLP